MSAAFFSNTILAAAQGETVSASVLMLLGFASGEQRVWRGYGELVTNDGARWQGIGEIGQIEGLDQAINGAAPKSTITISGVLPYALTAATNSWHEARNRPLTVYLQFFGEDGRPLDNPAPVAFLTMEQIQPELKGPTERNLIIHCENKFAARGFPPHGWLSDRDQQARYPGDRGLERIPILQYHVTTWPRA